MLKLKTLQKKPNTKKIKLGFYPYTYVRSVVMRSQLFKKADYDKMQKMGFSEIAKFLQESHYKKEINELATQFSGPDLLELALNRNLSRSFKKLIKISAKELGLLVNEYTKRKDIEDLKTILRGRLTKTDSKLIKNSLTRAGTLSSGLLNSLIDKNNVEDILKNNGLLDFSLFKDGIKEFKEKNSLAGIENILDIHYYNGIIKFSNSLPKEGKLFRDFLFKEVEVVNILTLFRLKKTNFDKSKIKNFIIHYENALKDSKIAHMIELKDIEELAKSMQKTEYKNIVARGIGQYKKSGSLIELETGLYRHLLRQSVLFLHQHPLSLDVILGYMFIKDLEVRNLKILIKGKQLGLSDEFIESQLIYE